MTKPKTSTMISLEISFKSKNVMFLSWQADLIGEHMKKDISQGRKRRISIKAYEKKNLKTFTELFTFTHIHMNLYIHTPTYI